MAPPFPTVPVAVDIIIEDLDGERIVLIERRDEPHGFAIPGGFVEPGESCEEAAVREAKEETGLDVQVIEQFYAYSRPGRDPRGPVCSVVFIAKGIGTPKGGDDAKVARWHRLSAAQTADEEKRFPSLPVDMAFDHKSIITDYKNYAKNGIRPGSHKKARY
jgi:8-oxo-dGTP diphosphatase